MLQLLCGKPKFLKFKSLTANEDELFKEMATITLGVVKSVHHHLPKGAAGHSFGDWGAYHLPYSVYLNVTAFLTHLSWLKPLAKQARPLLTVAPLCSLALARRSS